MLVINRLYNHLLHDKDDIEDNTDTDCDEKTATNVKINTDDYKVVHLCRDKG